MDKYTWYVINIESNNKYLALTQRVCNNQNLVGIFTYLAPNGEKAETKTINACDSKHEAIKIANYWNECYKQNGTNLY